MADTSNDSSVEAPKEGVVNKRRVVSRPMSWQDGAKRQGGEAAAKALEEDNPNAPKPTPRNEYVRQMKQLRRRHKSNQRSVPNYMSDVKI